MVNWIEKNWIDPQQVKIYENMKANASTAVYETLSSTRTYQIEIRALQTPKGRALSEDRQVPL